MKALVVYGSKRGGTQGLAEMVGRALTDQGLEVTVRPASVRGHDVGTYDVVVVGGALYAGRWHKDARSFVRRATGDLRGRRVWLFSSGPLGDAAASAASVGPTSQVEHLMARIGARGHITFGGRLAADAKGFPASAMAKKMAGDWRDEEAVRVWVKEIASELV
jgi:menaquinone-dependent protoporphyrinogen oxidase